MLSYFHKDATSTAPLCRHMPCCVCVKDSKALCTAALFSALCAVAQSTSINVNTNMAVRSAGLQLPWPLILASLLLCLQCSVLAFSPTDVPSLIASRAVPSVAIADRIEWSFEQNSSLTAGWSFGWNSWTTKLDKMVHNTTGAAANETSAGLAGAGQNAIQICQTSDAVKSSITYVFNVSRWHAGESVLQSCD